jgi:hypothetical protein
VDSISRSQLTVTVGSPTVDATVLYCTCVGMASSDSRRSRQHRGCRRRQNVNIIPVPQLTECIRSPTVDAVVCSQDHTRMPCTRHNVCGASDDVSSARCFNVIGVAGSQLTMAIETPAAHAAINRKDHTAVVTADSNRLHTREHVKDGRLRA